MKLSESFFHSKTTIHSLIVFLLFNVCGCTSQKKQLSQFDNQIDYKRMMDLQKQGNSIPLEEEIPEKVKELTPEECERLGDAFNKQNNIGKAFVFYNKSLRLKPNQNRVLYKTGLLLIRKGMFDDAYNMFEKILENDSKNAQACEGLGMVSLARGNIEESIQYFKETIKLNQESWRAHVYLGIIYDHQKLYDAAIKEYQEAIVLNPQSYISYNNLGVSFYLKENYKKSMEAFQSALKINPGNQKVYNNLGLVLCKMNKYDEAFLTFQNCGDDASAYNNVGYLYMTDQKFEKALEAFEKAIDIKPQYYSKAHENREAVLFTLTKLSVDTKEKKPNRLSIND